MPGEEKDPGGGMYVPGGSNGALAAAIQNQPIRIVNCCAVLSRIPGSCNGNTHRPLTVTMGPSDLL